jgi:hypothetical protein
MKSKSSSAVSKALKTYISGQGPPKYIYSDVDPSFRGEVEQMLRMYDIKHITSFPYTQRQNTVEASVRTFKNAYRAAILESTVFKSRDWTELYPLVICRINAMISKYGMSRESCHFGQIVESHLPIITDTKHFKPLEDDLENISKEFKKRMGKFMKKRERNKLHYKIGKQIGYYMHELVMMKVYVTDALSPTFKGPLRIIDIQPKGAVLYDVKTGEEVSVAYENLRKINFEELLTFLPDRFDNEICDTLGIYRYKKKGKDPLHGPEETLTPNPEETEINVADKDELTESGMDISDEFQGRKLRSGRVYNLNLKDMKVFEKLNGRRAHWRNAVITRPINTLITKVKGILSKPQGILSFPYPTVSQIWDDRSNIWCYNSRTREHGRSEKSKKIRRSTFSSSLPGTLTVVLENEKSDGRVRFGQLTVFFYEND